MTTEGIVNEIATASHMTRSAGRDAEGWWFVECECRWRSEGLPDLDIAFDDYGDHRAEIERLDRAGERQ